MKNKIDSALFIGLLTFFLITSVYAVTYLYSADEVSYDNSNSNLLSTNVQDALDELYTKCNASTTTTPSNYTCTQKINIKCKRATVLHTEDCANTSTSDFCQGTGYSLNDTITYGNETVIEGVLTVGDAFDCDVNGDGVFNSETERFYYISDYFDTSEIRFNDKIAVLVYYSNTTSGVASKSSSVYDSSDENWHGPRTGVVNLPTTSQWSNISLYKETRYILEIDSEPHNPQNNIPNSFSYSGYAARLLTFQEIHHGCYDYKTQLYYSKGLDSCQFLLESTKYADPSSSTQGSWTETTGGANDLNDNYRWISRFRYVSDAGSSPNVMAGSIVGMRPAIEIPKDQILY